MIERIIMLAVLSACPVVVHAGKFVVADSTTRAPLANAAVFNKSGHLIGISRADGVVNCTSASDCPLTVRYLGFKEKCVGALDADTVFMKENVMGLQEVVVESRKMKRLHILAYVREYSTLSSYTDTVTMFREKMVDFMLPSDKDETKVSWRYPRVLASRSYYRFTDSNGLDSVSDRCSCHFTWSDWVGILPPAVIPPAIAGKDFVTDTLRGKYSPAEIWVRNGDRLSIDVNVLADVSGRRWTPDLSSFFGMENMDFEQFRLRYNYDNITSDMMTPLDLTGYSFNIESRNRGRDMFLFNKRDRPSFVTTYAEVYILDKEYITMKEARKWDKRDFDTSKIVIYEPMEAPELQPSVLALIDRVNRIDTDGIRQSISPDHRLISRNVSKVNFSIGHRMLSMLKDLTGITYFRSHRHFDKNWRDFRQDQNAKNHNPDAANR